jgi:uncharacterized sulfatase
MSLHRICSILFIFLGIIPCWAQHKTTEKPINILIAISDDQSYPYTGAYGNKTVETPAFDWVAENGILFTNAFASSPGCAPSRSSILTGRYPWQNEEAGSHQTLYPLAYKVLVDVLEENGYFIGYTGKGCSPFNWRMSGRKRNPAGNEFNQIKYKKDEKPTNGISNINYAANFDQFLAQKPKDQPFYFWYGAFEPHRKFEEGSGQKSGKLLKDAFVPAFLPNDATIQTDVLDYALEIDWFDHHLEKIIASLKKSNQLDNTIIIVTSDNGMAFPRAKANCYEYGIHVPLAVYLPKGMVKKRVVDDLVSLTDITPTLLDLTQIKPKGMKAISGKSFYNILTSNKNGQVDADRTAIYSSRERHSCARWANLGYPIRSIRTKKYLYIRNYYPERWPAGAPQTLNFSDPTQLENKYGLNADEKFNGKAFYDIDAALSKRHLIENYNKKGISTYFELAVGKRPQDELYDIEKDPDCLNNLAKNPTYQAILQEHQNQLTAFLKKTKDPRHVGPYPNVFENYQRFSVLRPFPKPDWVK